MQKPIASLIGFLILTALAVGPASAQTTATASPQVRASQATTARPQATTAGRTSTNPSASASPSVDSSSRPATSPASDRAAQAQQRVDEKRSERTGNREERIRAMSKQMTERLQAAHDRQENLLGRMQSRVGKLKEQRVNVVAVERQLTALTTTLTTQQALIDAIIPNLDKMMSDTTSNSGMQSFRDSVKKTSDSIKKTQDSLRTTFTEIARLGGNTSSARPSGTPAATTRASGLPTASVRSSSTATNRPVNSPTVRATTTPEAQ